VWHDADRRWATRDDPAGCARLSAGKGAREAGAPAGRRRLLSIEKRTHQHIRGRTFPEFTRRSCNSLSTNHLDRRALGWCRFRGDASLLGRVTSGYTGHSPQASRPATRLRCYLRIHTRPSGGLPAGGRLDTGQSGVHPRSAGVGRPCRAMTYGLHTGSGRVWLAPCSPIDGRVGGGRRVATEGAGPYPARQPGVYREVTFRCRAGRRRARVSGDH
jgi:hypothetical protein